MIIFRLSFAHSHFTNLVQSVANSTIKRTVLPETYLKEVRPPSAKGNPVVIEFSVFVVDINSINVVDMDFRVDMFIHQKWKESRLTLSDDLFEDGDDYVTLPPEFFDHLWQPDPYFLNSKVAGKQSILDEQLQFSITVPSDLCLTIKNLALSRVIGNC